MIGLSVIGALVGARALRFWLDGGPALRSALQPLLDGTTTLFLTSFTAFFLNGILVGAMLLPALFFWWPLFARRIDGELRFTGWVHFFAWAELILNQHFFDMNRFLFPWFAGTLVLVWGLPRLARATGGSVPLVFGLGWAAATGVGAWLAPCGADLAGVVLWGLANWWLHVPMRQRLGGLERLGFTVLAIPIVQLIVVSRDTLLLSMLPVLVIGTVVLVVKLWPRSRWLALAAGLAFPVAMINFTDSVLSKAFDHGGRLLGPGLAYSFCELSDPTRIVAAVPVCQIGGENCQEGHLLIYDPARDWAAERIDPFDEDHFGRLEQVVCMERELQIGMCCVTDGDHVKEEDTLRLTLAEPHESEIGHRGHPLARRLVWDRANDAIYYVGQFVRVLDRRTGELSDGLNRTLEELDPGPIPSGAIFTAEWGSLHEGRNSVYVSEFARGSRIYAVDRTSGEVRLLTDAENGGVLGVTVDEPLDRLYVNGLYGIDIYDLEGDRIVATLRTGTLARVPVIDERRNLIYVPCTVGGRIEVFDRLSFEHLGAISIGIETRNAMITRSGEWFVASEVQNHYVWPAESLARRFGWSP